MKSSDIIKDIRSRLNLSQTELAEKLGVSFATVNRWEKGHRAPSQIALGNIKRLCAFVLLKPAADISDLPQITKKIVRAIKNKNIYVFLINKLKF